MIFIPKSLRAATACCFLNINNRLLPGVLFHILVLLFEINLISFPTPSPPKRERGKGTEDVWAMS